jgi:modification methylase
VAKRLRRRFIGIERDATYVEAARARIATIAPLAADAAEITRGKRAAPRVPFGALIEQGLVTPGAILISHDGKHRAKVRADGSLVVDGATGSIHQIAAHVQGLEAFNGWAYWCVKGKSGREPIDNLREKIRSQMVL